MTSECRAELHSPAQKDTKTDTKTTKTTTDATKRRRRHGVMLTEFAEFGRNQAQVTNTSVPPHHHPQPPTSRHPLPTTATTKSRNQAQVEITEQILATRQFGPIPALAVLQWMGGWAQTASTAPIGAQQTQIQIGAQPKKREKAPGHSKAPKASPKQKRQSATSA